MTVAVAAISAAGYIITLLCFRERDFTKQLILLGIYLIGLTAIGELDVILPVYFVFTCLPFLNACRKISRSTFFYFCYFGLYFAYGLFFQNFTAASGVFISKYWQFLVFFVVFDVLGKVKNDNSGKLLFAAMLLETAIGIYLLFHAKYRDTNGLLRLTSNAQPITGNLTVAFLPTTVYLYYKNKGNPQYETKIILISLVFLLWSILSGTRGYTLMYALTMVIVFIDYYFNYRRKNRNTRINRAIFVFAILIVAMLIIIFVPYILEKISSILRLKASVGIRTYENAAEWEFFCNAPWHIKLFGIGMGGTAGKYIDYTNAIYRQISYGMWNSRHYLYESGSMYHSLYSNALLSLGAVGIVIFVIMNIDMWNRIKMSCQSRSVRRCMHLYQLGFLLMNYYRWSAACGIGEMIMFGMTIRLLYNEKTCEQGD